MKIRPAEDRELAAIAVLRSLGWEVPEFWEPRIALYLSGEHSPQQALAPRAAFVAVEDGKVVGFVAGHRTRRFGYDGELQWINVAHEQRGAGVAGSLLAAIAAWFVQESALRVCVNVEPNNVAARRFYEKFGARSLREYWMTWEDIRVVDGRLQDASGFAL